MTKRKPREPGRPRRAQYREVCDGCLDRVYPEQIVGRLCATCRKDPTRAWLSRK